MERNLIHDFLDSMARLAKNSIIDGVSDALKEKKPVQSGGAPIRLTAEKLREIRWMTAKQIYTIYKGGKTKFVVDNTPEAYRELRWMDQEQLEALFGKGDETNE